MRSFVLPIKVVFAISFLELYSFSSQNIFDVTAFAEQNAGSYTVDFNSAEFNLLGRIYFYTLNTVDFKEAKKMVLVK